MIDADLAHVLASGGIGVIHPRTATRIKYADESQTTDPALRRFVSRELSGLENRDTAYRIQFRAERKRRGGAVVCKACGGDE